MKNNTINSKEYWNDRFASGAWSRMGRVQTREYAKENIKHLPISVDFSGSILDFGCALGDAIPVYKTTFPRAKLFGTDFSDLAIKKCKQKFGKIAKFFTTDANSIGNFDVIIASHVMEHLNNDKDLLKGLLNKCQDLFVFVPYKESPLFVEHVNYYEENYYNEFNVLLTKTFTVRYKTILPFRAIVKNCLHLKSDFFFQMEKEIILFHIKEKSN